MNILMLKLMFRRPELFSVVRPKISSGAPGCCFKTALTNVAKNLCNVINLVLRKHRNYVNLAAKVLVNCLQKLQKFAVCLV